MGRLAGQGVVLLRVSSTLMVSSSLVSLCYASRGPDKVMSITVNSKEVKTAAEAEQARHLDPRHHSGFGPDGVMIECLGCAEKRSKHKTTWQLIHEPMYPPLIRIP